MSNIKMISAAVFLLLLGSCTKAIIEDTTPIDPVVGPITYTGHIQRIMLDNCVTCHSGLSPSAGLDLTTYQNTRFSAESGNLLSRVGDQGNPMPPSGLLSGQLQAQIAKWAADGFPEN